MRSAIGRDVSDDLRGRSLDLDDAIAELSEKGDSRALAKCLKAGNASPLSVLRKKALSARLIGGGCAWLVSIATIRRCPHNMRVGVYSPRNATNQQAINIGKILFLEIDAIFCRDRNCEP